ncbi:MAG: hypothetical protein O3A47_05020 [Chloroflexi bacterium]|nr:hypothetical protein [Chloroflexota bacterium]
MYKTWLNTSGPITPRRVGILTALYIVLSAQVVLASCGGDTESVRGRIVEVVPASLVDLDSLTVEDDQGIRWTFDGQGKRFANFSPSHLREHMVQGTPVTAWFEEKEGVLVLKEIGD